MLQASLASKLFVIFIVLTLSIVSIAAKPNQLDTFCERKPWHHHCATPSPSPTPTIIPTASPTPSPTIQPTPVPTPIPTPVSGCTQSLQSQVDAAASGSVVSIPDCIYHESVSITKPLTLVTSGAILDGQDSRTYAFVIGSDDVVLDGFEITAYTNPAQDGSIRVRNSDRFILRNTYIHDTAGACISIAGGSGHQILDSELAYCDQEGFHLPSITNSLIARNEIHHNNPNGQYSTGFEAGGGKLSSRADHVTFENNEVHHNVGFGLWADGAITNVIFRGNRAHHNTRGGIFLELSHSGLIENNVVYENGWSFTTWGWGAGILVNSTSNAEIHNNVVAWNPDGIAVMSQNRTFAGETMQVRNVYVHHNDILRQDVSDGSMIVLLGWQQDWDGSVMLDPASNNRGELNHYWFPRPEPTSRFEWDGVIGTLSTFNATPGEEGGTYLTADEKDLILSEHSIPPPELN